MPSMTSLTSDPAITIRNDIRAGDIGSIIELHGVLYAEAYGFDHTFEPYVAIPLAEFVQNQGDGDRIWIVEKDQRVRGSVAIVKVSDRRAQLRWLLLHPTARGRGVGQALVEKAIAFSRSYGYDSVFLWSIDFLTEALKLYEAGGFKLKESKTHQLWGRVVTEQRYELEFK